MASVVAAPANLTLTCTKGDDYTVTCTVTENSVAYDWTGATVTTAIWSGDARTEQATDFTVATPTNGTLTLTLTDANTTTLGEGPFRYTVSVTKSGATRTWLAGPLNVLGVTTPDSGSSSATLAISSALAVTIALTASGDASSISLLDTAGYYIATNVETALAELRTTLSPRFDSPTVAISQTTSRALALSSTISMSTGRLRLTMIWLPAGAVSTITFVSGGTAAGTPTNQWFALYDINRNLLAVTNDDTTTAWAGSTFKTLSIAGGYTVTTPAYYYVGIMVAATTPPTLCGAGSLTLLSGVAPILSGTDNTNTGLTTPATAPVAAAALTSGQVPYAYVS